MASFLRRGARRRFGFSSAACCAAAAPPSPSATLIVMWHVRFLMLDTRPRARGRQRLIVGPSSTYAAVMTRSSPESPWFASAFATAERSTFSTSRATARSEKARTVRASGTVRPRMCSTTSRALRGETRTNFASARTSFVFSTAAI